MNTKQSTNEPPQPAVQPTYRMGSCEFVAESRHLTLQLRASNDFHPAGEPTDDRWAGDIPKGHTEMWKPGAQLEPLPVSRAKWGV